jgi:hypothetical protein
MNVHAARIRVFIILRTVSTITDLLHDKFSHGGEMFTGFWLGGLKGRDHRIDLGVGGRKTLS